MLQELIDAARPGDVLQLEPGDYVGNFKLNKSGITILGAGELPNRRVRPSDTQTRIVSPNTAPALEFEQGVEDVTCQLVEITSPVYNFDLIRIGSLSETDPGRQPRNILFDRIYLHGDPVLGAKRGAMISASDVTFQHSHVSDFKAKGQDTMGFAVCNSPEPGNLKWINDYVEAAGYPIIFGGCNFKLPDMLPSDVIVRGNHFHRPLSWQTEGYSVKNLFEIKNGRRVVVEGNIFENNWASSQTGFAILFTAKPGGIRADGSPFSEISDVAFRNNLVLNSTSGMNIAAGSGVLRNLKIENNKFENVPQRLFQVLGNIDGFRLTNNTALETAVNAILTSGAGYSATNAVIMRNLLAMGSYGVKGSGMKTGLKTIESYFPGAQFTENALIGGDAAAYPPGNVFDLQPGYGADENALNAAIAAARSGELPATEEPLPGEPAMTDSEVLRETLRLVRGLAGRK